MRFFICGTDTNIGKTYVTVQLLKHFKEKNYRAVGLKPIATGGMPNEDALLLHQNSSIILDYNTINPFCLNMPISPNIASDIEGIDLNINNILASLKLDEINADIILIEGSGGVEVPINNTETMLDLAYNLDIPIIVVVGIKLGCINHAILSHKAIINKGAKFAGWIANIIDPDNLETEAVIDTIKNYINAHCLGRVEYGGEITLHMSFTIYNLNEIR
ncbi:MAG: dethiobiotin synthase [Alphaproteobacteria bacterium 33-17]|nr:MAG: dethiobiotin synthase [Alphaproteobacteria bacterium 33-17]